MKKLASLILLAALFMVGCQDDNSILEPTDDFIKESLNKGRPILDRDLDDFLLYDSLGTIKSYDLEDDRELDDYEDEDGYKVTYSKSFTIDGSKGGRLAIKHQWKNVWLKSELYIPRGAFKGTKTFDMIFDIDNLSMELYPSPFTFDKPVEFSMYWYGLDLDGYRDYDFDFNYLDGEREKIEYYRKSVDYDNGNLIVWGAQLHHFSRYGWTRTGD